MDWKHDFKVGHQTVWEGMVCGFAEARRKGDELATRMGEVVQWDAIPLGISRARWETKGWFLGLGQLKSASGAIVYEMNDDYTKLYEYKDFATSYRQALRLSELGLERESADMRYNNDAPGNGIVLARPTKPVHIPAWSMARMMELLNKWTSKWDLEPTTSPKGFTYMLTFWGEDIPSQEGVMTFKEYTPAGALCGGLTYLLREHIPRKEADHE